MSIEFKFMKIKLIIALFLLAANLTFAQKNKFSIGTELIPSFYRAKYAEVLYHRYGIDVHPDKFTLLKNLNLEYMISNRIGIRIGLQQHSETIQNSEGFTQFESTDVIHSSTFNSDYSSKANNQYYEIPIELLLSKPINDKLDLSLLLGGASVKLSTVKYKFTNKETEAVMTQKDRFQPGKIFSTFSPQLKARLQYKVGAKFKVSSLLLLKSRRLTKFNQGYIGVGIGFSYQLN